MSHTEVVCDISIGGSTAGRVVMELYAVTTPLTAENFCALPVPLHFMLNMLSTSSDEAREQEESNAKPHCHAVFKNLNISLLAIVGIKYQAISQDPFKTLAPYTWSFVIAIVIYSLMLFPVKQLQNRCNVYLKIVLGRVLFASGVVSSLSLMSLLLPHMHGLVVIYISWALFVVISALPLLQRVCNGLCPGITTVINFLVCFTRNLFTGSNLSQQQPPTQETRPPV